MSPFLTIVPIHDNQKEEINRALDVIIKKCENNESLIPSDEEIKAGINASKDVLNEEKSKRTNPDEIKEIEEVMKTLEDFYYRTINTIKSYNEDTINHILTSARWIREKQKCPAHVSLRMYTVLGNSEFAEYIEMIRCLKEECYNMPAYDGLDIQFSETENPRILVGVVKKKDEENNERSEE